MIGAIFVKYSQLILMKIIKIVTTRYQILRLKCTKFNFGWGFAQTLLGELTALSRPLAGFKGPTSKGRGGERWKWRERKGPSIFSADLRPWPWELPVSKSRGQGQGHRNKNVSACVCCVFY